MAQSTLTGVVITAFSQPKKRKREGGGRGRSYGFLTASNVEDDIIFHVEAGRKIASDGSFTDEDEPRRPDVGTEIIFQMETSSQGHRAILWGFSPDKKK